MCWRRGKVGTPGRAGGGFWVGTPTGFYPAATSGQPSQPVTGLSACLGSAVTALAYAPGSGLWMGTAANGIYLLPAKTATIPSLAARHFTTANGLLHNSIYALLADHAGRVWVSTHNTSLAVWEPATRRFRYEKLTPVGLGASALAEDVAGTIWVGTEGQGLYFQAVGGRWQHLEKATGTLPDYYLTALLPLPAPLAGSLLLVHPRGLTLLDPRHRPTPLAAPDDQLVRGLLPAAAGLARHPRQHLAPRPYSIGANPARRGPYPRLGAQRAEVDG